MRENFGSLSGLLDTGRVMRVSNSPDSTDVFTLHAFVLTVSITAFIISFMGVRLILVNGLHTAQLDLKWV